MRERERARGSTERDGNAGTMGVELCVNKFFVCGAFLAIFLAFFYQLLTPLVVVVAIDLFVVVGGFCVVAV